MRIICLFLLLVLMSCGTSKSLLGDGNLSDLTSLKFDTNDKYQDCSSNNRYKISEKSPKKRGIFGFNRKKSKLSINTDSVKNSNYHKNIGDSYDDEFNLENFEFRDSCQEENNTTKPLDCETINDFDGDGVVDSELSKVKINWKRNNNIIKKVSEEVKLGQVLYQTPDTMILLVESKVIVRISKGKLDTAQISEGLSGPVNGVKINVTSKMEVKLLDPSPDNDRSFEIRDINKSQQVIEDEVYTEWLFTVVPLKTGEHELKLVISIIRNGEIKEQTWSDTIRVKNNVPKKVLTFWEKYWQWLLTTIIIPIIVYFWKKREEKKKKD